jgi:uncharacterized protein YbjT (DUF2867 family)
MRKFSTILLTTLLIAMTVSCGSSGNDSPDRRLSILVTGATGTQGGAVARELLARGYNVRGLTRSPKSDRAQALADLGVTVVKGDFDDAMSLAAAMRDVHGVFAVTSFWEHGFDREVAHGRQLIDAARLADVGHFVFTSVAGAETGTGLAHFDSKLEIEKILQKSGLNYSVVRPVEFMDNIRYTKQEVMSGTLGDPRDGSQSHQWIAASDIGFFCRRDVRQTRSVERPGSQHRRR